MPSKELWEAYSNHIVRPSRFVSGAYLLYYVRNPKFSMWMNIGMAKCHIPFSGHCDLDLFRIYVSGANLSYHLR